MGICSSCLACEDDGWIGEPGQTTEQQIGELCLPLLSRKGILILTFHRRRKAEPVATLVRLFVWRNQKVLAFHRPRKAEPKATLVRC